MIFLEFLLFKEMKMSWSPIILWQIGKRQIVGVGDDCLESFRVWSPIRSEDDILETTEVKGQKMTFWIPLWWKVRRWHFEVHCSERWGPFCGGGFPRTSVCLLGKSSRRSQVETREPQPFRASSWTLPSQIVPTPSYESTSSSLSRRTQFPKVN